VPADFPVLRASLAHRVVPLVRALFGTINLKAAPRLRFHWSTGFNFPRTIPASCNSYRPTSPNPEVPAGVRDINGTSVISVFMFSATSTEQRLRYRLLRNPPTSSQNERAFPLRRLPANNSNMWSTVAQVHAFAYGCEPLYFRQVGVRPTT
jgi:hypothetical protein